MLPSGSHWKLNIKTIKIKTTNKLVNMSKVKQRNERLRCCQSHKSDDDDRTEEHNTKAECFKCGK